MPLSILLTVMAMLLPTDLLHLARARVGPGVPEGWKVRVVRGQRAPDIEVSHHGDGPILRIQGAGRAAWFFRELSPKLEESDGRLHWAWRVLEAPAHADLRSEPLDDSPIRLYVVFGRPGVFGNAARIIFYTFGNAEPAGFERASLVSDKLYVIRVAGSGDRGEWREHDADPFADYRRIWQRVPPAITAVGVMQDTDQTRGQATAEIRRLEWVAR